MNITTVSECGYEPVTMTEVYSHLRLDPDGSPLSHPHDAMLRGYIKTARMDVESKTRSTLMEKRLRMSMPSFHTQVGDRWTGLRGIQLHQPPIIRIDSVSYYDSDNVLVVVDPASYFVTDQQVPELRFYVDFTFPTRSVRPDAIRIEYTAGYLGNGSPPSNQVDYAANVPETLKTAILFGIQLLYDDLTPVDRVAMERTQGMLLYPFIMVAT